jgi:hypothetical protein
VVAVGREVDYVDRYLSETRGAVETTVIAPPPSRRIETAPYCGPFGATKAKALPVKRRVTRASDADVRRT